MTPLTFDLIWLLYLAITQRSKTTLLITFIFHIFNVTITVLKIQFKIILTLFPNWVSVSRWSVLLLSNNSTRSAVPSTVEDRFSVRSDSFVILFSDLLYWNQIIFNLLVLKLQHFKCHISLVYYAWIYLANFSLQENQFQVIMHHYEIQCMLLCITRTNNKTLQLMKLKSKLNFK